MLDVENQNENTSADENPSAGEETQTDEAIWAEFEDQDGESKDNDDDDQSDGAGNGLDTDDDGQSSSNDNEDGQGAGSSGEKDTDKGGNTDPAKELEDLRAATEELEQKYRSEQSRSIGQQRKAEALQKEVETLKAALEKKKDIDTDARAERKAKLKGVSEEYEDVVGPLIGEIEELQDLNKQLDDRDKSRLDTAQRDLDAIIEQETSVFEQAHDDGLSVVNENKAAFDAWIEDQPKMLRDIRARNADNIVDGQGAALLVSRFKEALKTAENNSENSGKTATETRRAQQKRGATTPKHTSRTPVASDLPVNEQDEQAIWDDFERKGL